MIFKASLIVILSLYSTLFYAQNIKQMPTDSALSAVINKRFKGGDKAFFIHISQSFKFPREAIENCRFGIVLVTMKIRPTGVIDSILFRNDTPLGMGLEEEVARGLLTTKGQWLRAVEYSTIDLSIAFHEDEKIKPNAIVLVTLFTKGYNPYNCPSNSDLIKSFEKAKKKNKYKEAVELCEDILRRLPTSEEYKKELAELNAQLKK